MIKSCDSDCNSNAGELIIKIPRDAYSAAGPGELENSVTVLIICTSITSAIFLKFMVQSDLQFYINNEDYDLTFISSKMGRFTCVYLFLFSSAHHG